ncbi:MAG: hypothetical protein KDE31_25340 [Caldilineaceae bacterium]|nr:hypothetical protein [Caldilineaceae bacterium]
MTIYRVRTVDLAAEKASAAREVMVRAAAHLTARYPEIHVEILHKMADPSHRLHMVTRCASKEALAVYEAARTDDTGWLALLEAYQRLNAQTSAVDSIYELVE